MERTIKLLSHYLEYKLRLKPSDNEDKVEWVTDECTECGNITWELKINDFYPGIRVSESDLLGYVINNGLYFDDENKIHYYKE